jgi:hypothetical protein
MAFMTDIPLHDNDDCHRPYKDQNDCRHPCDHTFCDCYKDCEEQSCKDKCLSNHAKCYNKCCDDGKIDC